MPNKFFIYPTVLASLLLTTQVSAIETDVIDEKWGKPTLVYGGAISSEQAESLNNTFKISNIQNVNRLIATGKDMDKYLGFTNSTSSNMFSSVLIKKSDNGGVKVKILTPENITKISETQYANAAITAGVNNASIEVASPLKVTGESALTGVYVALSQNGDEVDVERSQVAQQELSTINEISQDLNKEESALLDNSMTQIKNELAEYKETHGTVAPNETVENIINKALKDNQLSDLVQSDEVSQLVSLAEAYQKTSAIDDEEVKKALSSLQDTMAEKFKSIKNTIVDEGFLEKIGNFFKNVFDSIGDFFKNLAK